MGKRILMLLVVFAFTLLNGDAFAKVRTYEMFLNTGIIQGEGEPFNVDAGTTVTGVTNVIVGGSGMNRQAGSKTIPWEDDAGKVWVVELASAVVSEHAQGQGGDNSGTTFSLWALGAINGNFDAARRQYLFFEQDLGATSPYVTSWEPIPGCDYQFRFESVGVTDFDRAKFVLKTGFPANFKLSGAFVLDESQYVINANSGVSTLTIPDGAWKMFIGVKGNDVAWSLDPDENVITSSGMVLNDGDYLTLDDYNQINNFSFALEDGGSGATVWAVALSK